MSTVSCNNLAIEQSNSLRIRFVVEVVIIKMNTLVILSAVCLLLILEISCRPSEDQSDERSSEESGESEESQESLESEESQESEYSSNENSYVQAQAVIIARETAASQSAAQPLLSATGLVNSMLTRRNI